MGCGRCGSESPEGAKFCMECGERLDKASAGALAGERKQVTVLFADVQGSMDLGSQLDSEVWRAIMDRFFGLVCSAVNGCDGTVDKFTGDGAMALFGAPRAYEDHARRACAAALRLQAEVGAYAERLAEERGIDLKVRIGLSSGEAIVGAIGADAEMAYTAIGPAVGLAARMESIAEPGRPCMTRATAELVDGFFALEPLGEREVKGVVEPVEVFALTGEGEARTALDAAQRRGLSKLVGRDHELAVLEQALERSSRSATVIGVVGEGGVGKSRLCGEFVQRCQGRGVEVTVGRGDPNGRSVPLLPIMEMLRDFLGIEAELDAPAARERVSSRLLTLDPRFGDALPVLFDFLGIADPETSAPAIDPDARQRILFGAVRGLLEARAGAGPSVVLVEDAHWLDPASEAFLDQLAESLPGTSTLLIVTFRTEYAAAWMRGSHYQQLPLVELSDDSVGELISDLVGEDPSVDGLAELIVERCGGNPLFVEELIRELVSTRTLTGERSAYRLARPVEQIDVPGTVKVIIAARIDRLPERVKDVLQVAAVIGGEFPARVVGEVTGRDPGELAEALDVLARAELVHRRATYPDERYAFAHALIEEVAYETQLAERRGPTHAATAAAIEATYPDRLDELAAVIARHHERGGDPLAAATWTARAATWSGRSDVAAAWRSWQHVRELLAGQEDEGEAANLIVAAGLGILQHAWRVAAGPDAIREVRDQVVRIATRMNNQWALTVAEVLYGVSLGFTAQLRPAVEAQLSARRRAEEIGDSELAVLTGTAGYWMLLLGDIEEGLADTEWTLATTAGDFDMGRAIAGVSSRMYAMFQRALLLIYCSRYREARLQLDEVIGIATELDGDDSEVIGWSSSLFGWLAYFTGVPENGVQGASTAVRIAEARGSVWSSIPAYYALAAAHLAGGDAGEALAAVRRGLAVVDESRFGSQDRPLLLALLSEGLLGIGRSDDAITAAREGAALARKLDEPPYEAFCLLALGKALGASDPGAARDHLLRGRRAPKLPAPYAPLCDFALACLPDTSPEDSRRLFALAREKFAAQGATGWVERVDAQLGLAIG